MPLFNGIFILLLFLVTISAIGLGLMIVLVFLVISRYNRELPNPMTASNQESGNQGDNSQIIQKIDDFRRESNRRHYLNLSYVLWGFALATTTLAIARINPLATTISIIEAIIFVLMGFGSLFYSYKFK